LVFLHYYFWSFLLQFNIHFSLSATQL
jgi:hypothetical protein